MKISTKLLNNSQFRKIFIAGIILTSCFTVTSNAQSFNQSFKKGTVYMNAANPNRYDERMSDTTLKYFLRCYAIDSTNANVSYIIGKLYLATAMHKAAALSYEEKAVKSTTKKYHVDDETEKQASPLAYYYLARAEHVNYLFDNAIDNFNKFKLMLRANDKKRADDIDYWVACCNSGKQLMQSPVDCKVIDMGEINSTYDDFAPVLNADESQLYFTSKRTSSEDTGSDREEIWVSNTGQGGVWGTPTDAGSPLNVTGKNSATVFLASDAETMIAYESYGYKNGTLYMSKMDAGNWGSLSMIDTGVIDMKPKTVYTPSACLTTDGKTLYFSSDRPGGQGGLDLYKSDMGSDGTWGPATNLGSTINTKYDEDCPFVSYDGSLLFFSSKGHNTMGGYDVFMSKGGAGNWGDPQNLGYPINTPDDDNYFVLNADGKRGYYNTVRLGSMGERDIYEVEFATPLPVQCVAVLDGYLKTSDGSPIPTDAKVTCTTAGSAAITTGANPTTGKFIVVLTPKQTYSIVVTAGGKQTNSYVYAPPTDSGYCTLSRAFYNGKIILGDTTDVFRPKPATPTMVASKFNTDPYFVKYFGYNLDAISENDPDFPTLVRNIDSAAKNTKIVVSIESSASTVPTTKYGTNDKLASARAEALKKTLLKKVDNAANVRFELKPSVNGPAYANDAKSVEKYGKFQYVKAYIREASDKDMASPSESSNTPASGGATVGSSASAGSFSIVVGSFSNKANADNLVNKYEKKNVHLTVIGQNKKGLYLIGYGNFQSRNEALAEQDAFRKKYNVNDTWVKAN